MYILLIFDKFSYHECKKIKRVANKRSRINKQQQRKIQLGYQHRRSIFK